MAKKYGRSNEDRQYKNSPEIRKMWREHYYRYAKPKREAEKTKRLRQKLRAGGNA